VLHALAIISSLTWSFCLAKSTSYEAPHYEVSSNLPSLNLSSAQIFSSAPRSQTPSVCVPPSMLETKFRTHTKPQAKFFFFFYGSTALWVWPLFQFPNQYTVGRTPWTSDQPVARSLPTHRTTKNIE
jgi:hypothetical protein